jgi:phosphoribosylanthranilate isomerase
MRSSAEAALAISCALGLVAAIPSGPGVISEEIIASIAATVPPPMATFLLTSEHSPEAIVAQQRRCRTNTVQLCDHLPAEVYSNSDRASRHRFGTGRTRIWTGIPTLHYALSAAVHADSLLLESRQP